jgi:hypothetical protein
MPKVLRLKAVTATASGTTTRLISLKTLWATDYLNKAKYLPTGRDKIAPLVSYLNEIHIPAYKFQ